MVVVYILNRILFRESLMKLLIMSDLHLEFMSGKPKDYSLKIPQDLDFDVFIFAGDIHVGRQAFNWFDYLRETFDQPIIYISGNHEYYGKDFNTLDKEMYKSAESRDNVHYLQYGEPFIIENTVFFGGTLWTDFDKENPLVMWEAQSQMTDYRVIKNFSPEKSLSVHKQTRQAIEERVKEFPNLSKVLVVHHAPSWNSIESRYKGSKLNGAYCTDLEQLLQSFDLAVHGHVHQSHDYMCGECRVVCNPAGYHKHSEKYNVTQNRK